MQFNDSDKVVVLGASRGLGRAISEQLSERVSALLLLSRRTSKLQELQAELSSMCKIQILALDFSNKQDQLKTQEVFQSFQPTRVIYCAGGGPFGEFHKKDWKDHNWAFDVTFYNAAFCLHLSLNFDSIQQVTLVGSSIAEDKPDPNAASYSAAKHALFGLYKTVCKEGHGKDVRLFSPSYMDTDMLPQNAPVREEHRIATAEEAASSLLTWLEDQSECGGHLTLLS